MNKFYVKTNSELRALIISTANTKRIPNGLS
ncbi:nucleotidyl transferase AbiEii/AbiGii toxin family protein [Mycoplasma mycoides subsp. capri]|nr:nucleotidyl transferase AbiEii/AbiGii toxin family protein [Mycoplasma mycoides subsp. capri]